MLAGCPDQAEPPAELEASGRHRKSKFNLRQNKLALACLAKSLKYLLPNQHLPIFTDAFEAPQIKMDARRKMKNQRVTWRARAPRSGVPGQL